MSDPLQQVFGLPATRLFNSRELVVAHGALERFPAFMHEGPMASIESLCKSFTGSLGTQSEYATSQRFERYIRLPNSSVRFEDDPAFGKLRCSVLSGPTNRPQAQTVLGIAHEARPVLDWILQSHAAFSVKALCEALPDYEPVEIEELLSQLARATLILPLPAPEWDDG